MRSPSSIPRAQRERWLSSRPSRSGTTVKPSATGSYCTIPREPSSAQVSTMSSPIASGHPPTARRSSVQYAENAPCATSAVLYEACIRFTPLIPSR